MTRRLDQCYPMGETIVSPAGRIQMALGFSPLTLYTGKGGEIMTDFEIFSMVAMIFSLVLRAFQLGRSFGNGKKHKK